MTTASERDLVPGGGDNDNSSGEELSSLANTKKIRLFKKKKNYLTIHC
jgi:hypothetical protein